MSKAKDMSKVRDTSKAKGMGKDAGRACASRGACAGRDVLGSVAVRGVRGSVMSFRSGGYRFDLGIDGRVVGFGLL